jgi:hypothetical protein
MSSYETLNRLEGTGELKELIQSGHMPVKVCTHLEVYRLVDMRVKTGSNKTTAVAEAAKIFRMCERSVFRVIRGMEQ